MAPGPTRRGMLAWLAAWLGSGASVSARPNEARLGARIASARSPDRDSGPGPPVVEVSLDGIEPGSVATVQWQGKPVFIRHRTEAEIVRERAVPVTELRDPEPDEARAERAEWVVVEGVCTHGGCIPHGPLGDYGGWYCFCHGSQFDTAGRVRFGPARENLEIPPYEFIGNGRLRIGTAADAG